MFFVMQNIWSYSIFINFNAPNVFFQKWKFSLFGQSTCYELNIFCPIWLKFCVWPPFVFTFAAQEWFHPRKNIWPDFLFFFFIWSEIRENCCNAISQRCRCINNSFCDPNLLQKLRMTPLQLCNKFLSSLMQTSSILVKQKWWKMTWQIFCLLLRVIFF